MGKDGDIHKGCLLYSRSPGRQRRASFAHIPNKAYCPGGESAEHRKAKEGWKSFLDEMLSMCDVCTWYGREEFPNHPCPQTNRPEGRSGDDDRMRPTCWGVLWLCKGCLEPHLHEILKGALHVETEWWTPGREARIDLALLDEAGTPTAFIELQRTHLSDNPFIYAKRHDIPMFVLDISQEAKYQVGLLNTLPKQRQWSDMDYNSFPPRGFDLVGYTLADNADGKELTLRLTTDQAGDAHWHLEGDADMKVNRMPAPSLGKFIWASQSTVPCKDVTGVFEKQVYQQ